MKKLWDYRVQVGQFAQHYESVYLIFALDTDDPERALETILGSRPFREALESNVKNHLVNFSGPNGFAWSDELF